MRKYLILIFAVLSQINILAQTSVYDESMQKQWQAMELGKIEFTPKEYYRFMHGEPELLNLWMGDRYAVYDWNWHWAGLHSGFRWDFNAEKSKAVNVNPKRVAAGVEYALTDKQYEEMMDSVNHELTRELGRAADCEIDKYYEVYKPSFEKYDKAVANLFTRYIVASGASSAGYADKLGVYDSVRLKMMELRQVTANTHSDYMESILKNEIYDQILQDWKKLHRRLNNLVYLVESSKKSK